MDNFLWPEQHQPKGRLDLNKIFMPETKTVTYTNLYSGIKEIHTVKRTDIKDKNSNIIECLYNLPCPTFFKK